MNLTAEELLTSMRYCMGDLGGATCEGCPNAVPRTEDRNGFCECRFNLDREMIRFLEEYVQEKSKYDRKTAPFGTVGRRCYSMEKTGYEVDDLEEMLREDAEDEQYRLHKKASYRYLIVESLLAFLLGMLVHFLFLQG